MVDFSPFFQRKHLKFALLLSGFLVMRR